MNKKNLSIYEISGGGLVPPQAIDLEEAVLGAMMLDRDGLMSATALLEAKDFYLDKHQRLFGGIINLINKGSVVDILTVTNEMKRTEDLEMVGGPYYITQLTSRVASAGHIEEHCLIIKQYSIKRQLITIFSGGVSKAYDDSFDVFELLSKSMFDMINLTSNLAVGRIEKLHDITSNSIDIITKVRDGVIPDTAILTHISKLNEALGGIKAPDLIILAARPSMGKTALALTLALEISKLNTPIGFFSLEMSKRQVGDRLLSQGSEMPHFLLQKPRTLDEGAVGALRLSNEKLEPVPFYIDDTPGINLLQFRSKVHEMVIKYGVKFIMMDYLQLMSGNKETKGREQQISEISRGLKAVAKEMNIPILALSQLNREAESRTDRRPILSDLRESGAIEQDADIVLLLYRPYYYKIVNDPEEDPNKRLTEDEMKVVAELDIAKNRNGTTGMLRLRWNKLQMRFTSWENPDEKIQREEDFDVPI